MTTWIRMLGVGVVLLSGASRARAGEVWTGAWENRFEDTKEEWVLELPDGMGEIEGTLRAGKTTSPVKARREGAWLEVTWTDAEGRITQARGVVGEGEWRGLTLSGGGGRMVEYGRFVLKRKTADQSPGD